MTRMRTAISNRAQLAALAFLVLATAALAFYAVNRPASTSAASATAPSGGAPFHLGAPTKVAVIGDSLTTGTPDGGNRDFNWTVKLASLMYDRATPIELTTSGNYQGGYTQTGLDGVTFAEQAATTVHDSADAVVIFGGNNDVGQDIRAAARRTFETAHAQAPNARLIVIGPIWRNANPPAPLLAIRDQIRDAALSANAMFVDPLSDAWFNDENSAKYFGADTPFDGGHTYMAGLIFPQIALVADRVNK